jgi:SSS family solute:Na+ symporter
VTLFFFFQGNLRPLDLHEGILGLLVHIPVLVVVSLLTKDRDPEGSERFLEAARGGSPSLSRS